MKQILNAGVVAFLAVLLTMPKAGLAACEEPVIKQLTDNDTNDTNIKVSGAHAVWQGKDSNGGDWEIFYYNGRAAIQVTDNNTNDIKPQIWGRNIVWQGRDPNGGDWEIFFYNGVCTIQLSNNNFDDINPQLSGRKVFWQSWDGNDWEIATAAIPVPVKMTVSPQTLNLKSQGRWIMVKVWLGNSLDATDVDISSLRLLKQVPPDRVLVSEKPNTLTIKFIRSEVQALLEPGNQVITLTGELNDGTVFSASDEIKVIKPGHSYNFSSGASFTSVSFDEMVIPTKP
jgi:hypothetical protein